MFGKRNIEGLDRSIDNIWKTLNNLLAKDRHGTVRPKVDMLADKHDNFEINTVKAINLLTREVEMLKKVKLEKK